MSLMLDTSAYSAFKRGHSQVIEKVRQARTILLPAIVIGELPATNDLWMAASAMEYGARLLTADGHFLEVPQIMTGQIEESER